MNIKNEEAANLLNVKKTIVEAGRIVSQALETMGRVITDKALKEQGVIIDGDNYSGSFEVLKKAFGVESNVLIEGLIQRECSDELDELESKRLLINNLNERISAEICNNSLGLNEFQTISTITLQDDGSIELVIVDVIEEFKKRYKEQQAKNEISR